MFERYNEPARRAIFFARWYAVHRPSKAIDTGDLILGILHEAKPTESPYSHFHSQREEMMTLFAANLKPEVVLTTSDIPLTDNSKRALAYAALEADLDRRRSIDPFHLYRGVLRTGDETAQALIARGYTLEALREASRIALPTIPDRHGKTPWRLRLSPWLQARVDWAILVFCVVCFAGMVLYLRSQN